MAPRPPIQAVIEEQTELDPQRRNWRMALFNEDGSPFSAGGGGGAWRDAGAVIMSSLSQLRAAGAWIVNAGGTGQIGIAADGNAASGILLDDTVTEARYVAAAIGDEASAGVQISMRLREAGAKPASLPSLDVYMADVIAEIDLPALGNNNMEILAGEPSPVISPLNLHATEIEIVAPGNVWPTGATVQLLARLQVR